MPILAWERHPVVLKLIATDFQGKGCFQVSGMVRYHDGPGNAVLIGDAAHSTGGSLGQGANSALLDVLALDAALNENPDNILAAVTTYSERQLPEGEALLDLLSLSGRQRSNPVVGIVYLVWSNILQTKLNEWFPNKVRPNVQTLLTQSLVPYSEIAKENAFWLSFGRK